MVGSEGRRVVEDERRRMRRRDAISAREEEDAPDVRAGEDGGARDLEAGGRAPVEAHEGVGDAEGKCRLRAACSLEAHFVDDGLLGGVGELNRARERFVQPPSECHGGL